MLGRENKSRFETKRLVRGLGQADTDLRRPTLGLAIHRVGKLLIDEILRIEAKGLGSPLFPGCRAQVAHHNFSLAGVDLRNLTKLQRIPLAGAAGEIVKDAAAHGFDGALAARLQELELIDREMRNKLYLAAL